ncbi:hypothetical protein E8E12_010795 [Didymella heteroderae]|uniref:AB hydrolase-1 domain-containing protein n=1 Tax=Didymella heteroderae TaxID=1769908 RepID=A0A9P5C4T8_9PLEO|nr:hypothetical protein E8E12_010795 [Didymella heteroderae]
MTHSTPHPSDEALEFLCSIRLHHIFTYTSNNITHRVSYSDYGSPTSPNVLLFFGGLLGGRLCYTPLDLLARKHNIRIIHADRPGTGGTTPVLIEDRIAAYLKMVVGLVQHLGIKCVALAAHSFGTVYAMNFLLLYPELLHPERPYVAFWTPWVSPEHSGVRHLQVAELLPASVIGKFSGLAKLINCSVMPVLGMSSSLSSAVTRSLQSSMPNRGAADVPPAQTNAQIQGWNEGGVYTLDLDNPEIVKDLRALLPTFLFAETIDGAGHDAQLCLRKPRSIPWSTPTQPWEDIDDAVRQLKSIIANDLQTGRRWVVDSFHAETDIMVRNKGRAWFDGCWQGDRTSENEESGIVYRSQIVEGSDHDFILDPVFGASEKWLERVAESFGTRAEA